MPGTRPAACSASFSEPAGTAAAAAAPSSLRSWTRCILPGAHCVASYTQEWVPEAPIPDEVVAAEPHSPCPIPLIDDYCVLC
jgi:hypothetical protein